MPQVEIDGEIVLREGALELFCYARAPTPKEHETIVRVSVRPRRIFEALGLVGLTPGKPMRYFHETRTVRPPSGDPVDVFVRYEQDERTRTVSACDWMLDAATKRPMARTHWLFTGSEWLDDRTFYADIEGTVVTTVDFPSSLVGLPQMHTSSDEELWLIANTDAIPPVGTPVTVLLRPATPALPATAR